MKKNSAPSRDHYNPELLLKGFQEDNNPMLFVYDLKNEEIRPQKPREVACEKHFYSCLIEGKLDTRIEKLLGKIETKAGPIISEKKFENLSFLKNQERKNFARFLATMRIRTPSFLNNMGLYKVAFKESTLYKAGQAPEFTQPRKTSITRDVVLLDPFIWWYCDYLTKNIVNLRWSVVKAASGKRFITSDNPLCSIMKPSSLNQSGINIIDEFQDPTLRIFLPLSKEYGWLGHFSDNNEGLVTADNEWMEMFERNCVKWAGRFLYASTYDENILQHALKYRQPPFGVNIPHALPEFTISEVELQRVKAQHPIKDCQQ